MVKAKDAAPLLQCLRLALVRDHPVRPLVVCLHISSRPAAIPRLIVPVNVNPIECRSRRPIAHVLDEAGKVIPAPADRDPAPAIQVVVTVILIKTARAHIFPSPVLARMGLGHAVLLVALGHDFPEQTATGRSVPASCLLYAGNSLIPAFTPEPPLVVAPAGVSLKKLDSR